MYTYEPDNTLPKYEQIITLREENVIINTDYATLCQINITDIDKIITNNLAMFPKICCSSCR